MRVIVLIIFCLSLMYCEKNTEPIGEGEVYFESNQKSYSVGDTIEIYLINKSNRAVYSFYPSGWGFSKYDDGEWKQLSIAVPDMIPQPVEHMQQKSLIKIDTFNESGLYRYQQYLYWDEQGKSQEGLGMLMSNEFEIIIGT